MFKLLRYIDWSEFSGLLVGAILAIVICVATYVLVQKLQQEGVLGKKEYSLYCDMVSAQGLRKGTNVQINGVNIGTVQNISLEKKGIVRLEFSIDTIYKQWITDKSVVYATRDQNIISERVVNVDISNVGDRILEDGEKLIAGEAKDIENVLKTANELIDQVGRLVVVADTLLAKVLDTSTSIGALLGSRILYNRLDDAAIGVNKLLSNVDELMVGVNSTFNLVNKSVPNAMLVADTLSSGVISVIDNLNLLTNRAFTLFNSLDTTVIHLGGTVDNLNSMINSAENIITDGSETLNNADEFMNGVSKIWFIRNKMPKKDSIPLLGDDAW